MDLERARWRHVLVASLVFLSVARSAPAPGPILVDWSSKSYGPDGPWHAINVSVGTPPQFVDLLPGKIRTSFPLGPTACKGLSQCPSRKGGYYDIGNSNTAKHPSQAIIAKAEALTFQKGYGFYGAVTTNGTVDPVSDTLRLYSGSVPVEVPRSGVEAISDGHNVNTDTGISYAITNGFLTLGAPFASEHLFGEPYPASVPHSFLYNQGVIPSPSLTFHFGSPLLDIPPSYVLGGYDRSRLLGKVISQEVPHTLHLQLKLLDIGVDVESGTSPFAFGAKAGLLTNTSGTPSSLLTLMNVALPYIALPRATCQVIADILPVFPSTEYGVYLWKTEDSLYKAIMSTQSYLYFNFENPSDPAGNAVSIKVPFRLLNLILDDPITTYPQPYFPCAPVDDLGEVALGRAFLQAATIGISWGIGEERSDSPGYWFLAQAPGPNVSKPDINQILPTDVSIYGHGDSWTRTWDGYWNASATPPRRNPASSTVLPGRGGHGLVPTSDAPDSSSGLSTGAKAGIGVGVGVLVVALAVLLGLCLFRRRQGRFHRQNRQSSSSALAYPKDIDSPDFSRTEVQETHTNPRGGDIIVGATGTVATASPATVHELPVPDSPAPPTPSSRGFIGYSPRSNAQTISTQYATAAPYDPDAIVSPISPGQWSAPTNEGTIYSPMSSPGGPPPSYPEMEADRGAELEAPREVEKSGFLVA